MGIENAGFTDPNGLDNPHWIVKYRDMLELRKKADQAEEPFRKLALDIADERSEFCNGRVVVFEESLVRFSCEGTGLYQGDEWFEEFPVQILFDRAATKMRGV